MYLFFVTDTSRPLKSILILSKGCVAFTRLWFFVFGKQGFQLAHVLFDHIILWTSSTETAMFLVFKEWVTGFNPGWNRESWILHSWNWFIAATVKKIKRVCWNIWSLGVDTVCQNSKPLFNAPSLICNFASTFVVKRITNCFLVCDEIQTVTSLVMSPSQNRFNNWIRVLLYCWMIQSTFTKKTGKESYCSFSLISVAAMAQFEGSVSKAKVMPWLLWIHNFQYLFNRVWKAVRAFRDNGNIIFPDSSVIFSKKLLIHFE